MKKFRVVIFAATLLLVAVVITGAAVLIVSGNPVLDTAFNIIAISVSGASVAIALISQYSAYKDRKELSKLVHGLNEIDEEVVEDGKLAEVIRGRLDEIIALDRKMSFKLDRLVKTRKK